MRAEGRVVAGVRTEDGSALADARVLLRGGPGASGPQAGANTTIGLVATNATLTKAQVTKVAQMAQDGLARAIYPAHTPSDGDAIFSLATGSFDGNASVSVIAGDAVPSGLLYSRTSPVAVSVTLNVYSTSVSLRRTPRCVR